MEPVYETFIEKVKVDIKRYRNVVNSWEQKQDI